MQRSVEIPMADPTAQDGGWTIDPKFLQSISDKTRDSESVGTEAVEAVILALFEIPWNPKALPNEPQFH